MPYRSKGMPTASDIAFQPGVTLAPAAAYLHGAAMLDMLDRTHA